MSYNNQVEVYVSEFKSWKDFQNFRLSVRQEARYFRSKLSDEFLDTLLATSKNRVKNLSKNSKLWRAQLGQEWREDENGVEEALPHPPSRMVPRTENVFEGRANPKGIPFLYLASEQETAMSEVRPWLGSSISLGLFSLEKDLRLIDLSLGHDKFIFYFNEPNSEEREKAVWYDIDRAFSRPVTRTDNHTEYIPTQIIAEFFKKNNFDGVIYKSNFGSNGYNIALFNIEDARLEQCHLFETKSINIDFQEVANPYFRKNLDGKDTFVRSKIISIGPVDKDQD